MSNTEQQGQQGQGDKPYQPGKTGDRSTQPGKDKGGASRSPDHTGGSGGSGGSQQPKPR
jgi:hypothetical protein